MLYHAKLLKRLERRFAEIDHSFETLSSEFQGLRERHRFCSSCLCFNLQVSILSFFPLCLSRTLSLFTILHFSSHYLSLFFSFSFFFSISIYLFQKLPLSIAAFYDSRYSCYISKCLLLFSK